MLKQAVGEFDRDNRGWLEFGPISTEKRACLASCGYCGSTIIMGGVQAGGERFCNKKCAQDAQVLAVSQYCSR
jgi:hypothetical protein